MFFGHQKWLKAVKACNREGHLQWSLLAFAIGITNPYKLTASSFIIFSVAVLMLILIGWRSSNQLVYASVQHFRNVCVIQEMSW